MGESGCGEDELEGEVGRVEAVGFVDFGYVGRFGEFDVHALLIL